MTDPYANCEPDCPHLDATRAPRSDPDALRAAATEMMLAYRDIEGDVINGRTDKAYEVLRDALTPRDTPEPRPPTWTAWSGGASDVHYEAPRDTPEEPRHKGCRSIRVWTPPAATAAGWRVIRPSGRNPMPETAAGRAPATPTGRWITSVDALGGHLNPDIVSAIEAEARALGRAEALAEQFAELTAEAEAFEAWYSTPGMGVNAWVGVDTRSGLYGGWSVEGDPLQDEWDESVMHTAEGATVAEVIADLIRIARDYRKRRDDERAEFAAIDNLETP